MIECSIQKVGLAAAILAIIALYSIIPEMGWFKKDEKNLEQYIPTCIPMFDEANRRLMEHMNYSSLILESPQVYINISTKCEEAIECIESTEVSIKSYTLDGKYNPCMFFVFYQGPFSRCADTLIAKVGAQIPCIETVFHAQFTNKTEKCDAWSRSMPCIVRAIVNSCDTIPTEKLSSKQTKKDFYADQIYNLTPAFCRDLE